MPSQNPETSDYFDVSNESEHPNEGVNSKESYNTECPDDFDASNASSSFERMKECYKKIGDNESQAFGVWQQLSESERSAALTHTQRMQGDLSSRSYLYVYLRDREWTKAASPVKQ